MPLKNSTEQSKTMPLIHFCLGILNLQTSSIPNLYSLLGSASVRASVYVLKRQLDKNINGWKNDGGFGTDSIVMVQCTSLHIINTFIMSYQWHKASGKINLNQYSVVATDLKPPQ